MSATPRFRPGASTVLGNMSFQGNISFNNPVPIATPTAPTDATTKAYVDSAITTVSTAPGSTEQIIYNNNGAYAASSNLTYALNTLTVPTVSTTTANITNSNVSILARAPTMQADTIYSNTHITPTTCIDFATLNNIRLLISNVEMMRLLSTGVTLAFSGLQKLSITAAAPVAGLLYTLFTVGTNYPTQLNFGIGAGTGFDNPNSFLNFGNSRISEVPTLGLVLTSGGASVYCANSLYMYYGSKILNLGTPTAATDAATKGYVDSFMPNTTVTNINRTVAAGATSNIVITTTANRAYRVTIEVATYGGTTGTAAQKGATFRKVYRLTCGAASLNLVEIANEAYGDGEMVGTDITASTTTATSYTVTITGHSSSITKWGGSVRSIETPA